MTIERRTEGPTPHGGAYATALIDEHGSVEITEYDEHDVPIANTYGRVPTGDMSFAEARELPIPEGLTPEEEQDWLTDQGVPWPAAVSVVHQRHPDEWPAPGVDFAAAPGRLFVPRRAESEDGSVIGDGAVEVCPRCGSDRLHGEERDAGRGPNGEAPERESYGSWVVCDACGREWPETSG